MGLIKLGNEKKKVNQEGNIPFNIKLKLKIAYNVVCS